MSTRPREEDPTVDPRAAEVAAATAAAAAPAADSAATDNAVGPDVFTTADGKPLTGATEEIKAMKRARIEKARADPACTFPYPLDVFQQTSIDHLEAGDSVLVSAHTSAGKTTVANYAIAKALREKKRVIFTSPIKALSNQKFREFGEQFGSVGLMTGDTTIKSDADCLVMTTEILRSMLYRGTEMLREVGCVIFDEVHYMRDKNRGVVWEETIIMLPEGCQYVFLSATIPNAHEFSKWVEHIHPNTTCHVVYTNYRPVPLQHYLYPANADGIFLIVDEKGKFRDDNFKKAMGSMSGGGAGAEGGAGATGGGVVVAGQDRGAKGKGGFSKGGGKGGKGGNNSKPIMEIIRLVMDRQMYPVITFAFSKAECERNALAMSKLNFNTPEEDALVAEVFKNAIENLSADDQTLPAIEHILPLLRRGVGIHHSGLLPILKEVVELLFQSGLVKVLFSTETFSMGLNMPARTVVFTSVKKFDGEKQRYLTGGEYIQMSGRAGRRGLDRVGVVIAMVDEAVEHDTLKNLTGGGADVLNSSFHLTYNMILNLLRVEDIDPTYMMMRSFAQYQRERSRPELERQVGALQGMILSTDVPNESVFKQYTLCSSLIAKKKEERLAVMRQPKYMTPFLVEGRLVKVIRAADGVNFFTGIVKGINMAAHTVDVAVICDKIDPSLGKSYSPCHVTAYTSETADLYTVTFNFADIATVCRFRINMPAGGSNTDKGRADLVAKLAELYRRQGDEVPTLTGEEMGIEKGSDFDKIGDQIEKLEKQIEKNAYYVVLQAATAAAKAAGTSGLLTTSAEATAMQQAYEKFQDKKRMEAQLEEVKEQLKEVSRTVFVEELNQMKRVLRRLDFLDKDELIMRKSRVACEITTTDENELLLTELLFHGVFNGMETEMVVALLSCLVNVHRTPDNFTLPEEFQPPLQELQKVVERIANVSMEAGLITSVQAFAPTDEKGNAMTREEKQRKDKDNKAKNMSDKVLPSLMEVTYKWAKGAKFSELVGITDAYEGDIVRMMRRLEEMLRQLAGAAKSPALGNAELHDKFLKGIELIKRDIVFASSLYL